MTNDADMFPTMTVMHEQLVVIPFEQVKIGANVELGPNDFDQGDFARKGESQSSTFSSISSSTCSTSSAGWSFSLLRVSMEFSLFPRFLCDLA